MAGGEKASLKGNIWSHHFMGNRWGKQWKQCQTLFWGAPKITADGDCSHEIKRCLLTPWKEIYDQPKVN